MFVRIGQEGGREGVVMVQQYTLNKLPNSNGFPQ